MGKKKSFKQVVQKLKADLVATHSANPDDFPAAVVLVHRAANLATDETKRRFADFKEAEINAAADREMGKLTAPGFGFEFNAEGTDKTLFDTLVVFLRALEKVLIQGHDGAVPVNPDESWRVSFADEEDVFLVPVPRRKWRLSPPADKEHDTFLRRALIAHRLIPVEFDNAPISFHKVDEIKTAKKSLGFGAALFENVHFAERNCDGKFLITSVAASNQSQVIKDAIENSHYQDCFATVFPELTVSPTSLEEIVTNLAEKPFLDGRPMCPPSIVLAGSWHAPCDGGHKNSCQIFDGDGLPIISYDKRLSYGGGRKDREDIVTGDKFPILITSEGLVAVAICLDFCDGLFEGPYSELDVDVIVVPSCGDEVTMNSHLRKAASVNIRYSTTTFVVQQGYPAKADKTGYVLLCANGSPPAVDQTEVSETWLRKFT
jgi:hypothetical protein